MVLGNKTYNMLKFLAQIVLPAVATLYAAVAMIWHLPMAAEVVATVTAVDTFLGVVLGISSSAYNNSDEKFDGSLQLRETEDGTNLHLSSLDEQAVLTKNELVLKVNR